MGNTFTDLSQLKKFRPAEPEPPPPEPEQTPEDRQLAGAANSADYFSSLLGTPSAQRQKGAPRRTTVVTPGTVARVRAEQAEDAFAAERDALNAEIEERQAVIDALALDAAEAKESLDRAQEELKQAQDELKQTEARADEELVKLKEELDQTKAALEAERSAPKVDPALQEEAAAKDREIARLQALLVEAQRTSLSSTVLLDKPERRRADVDARYVGFTVPDYFVVGYGLDYAEKYRNLKYIGVLKNMRLKLKNPCKQLSSVAQLLSVK